MHLNFPHHHHSSFITTYLIAKDEWTSPPIRP
jgi:hypothetical protein